MATTWDQIHRKSVKGKVEKPWPTEERWGTVYFGLSLERRGTEGKRLSGTPNHVALEPRLQTSCVAWTTQWETIICDDEYMKETKRCLEVKIRITDIGNSAGKTEDCPFKGELANRNLDLKKLARVQSRENELRRHWNHGRVRIFISWSHWWSLTAIKLYQKHAPVAVTNYRETSPTDTLHLARF